MDETQVAQLLQGMALTRHRVFKRALHEMTEVLVNLCRLYFPSEVVVSGPFIENAGVWKALTEALGQRDLLVGLPMPPLVRQRIGHQLEKEGAAMPLLLKGLHAAGGQFITTRTTRIGDMTNKAAVKSVSFHGLDALALCASDGAQAIVTLHGGHVVSWTTRRLRRASGCSCRPRRYSPTARPSAAACRWCFRSSRTGDRWPTTVLRVTPLWQLQHDELGPRGEALVVLRLVDDMRSRAVWPHRFVLELGVRVLGDSLDAGADLHQHRFGADAVHLCPAYLSAGRRRVARWRSTACRAGPTGTRPTDWTRRRTPCRW